ncbi:MAG: ATP-grasp domain-containing protein [Methanothermobacter sp.]|nr:ATP-grasp domain-containing protein [Methanothermobacter sp.]
MNLLIFEYATATGIQDPSILIEGRSMLEALLQDLWEFKPSYLISENFTGLVDYPNPIILREDLYSWIKENASEFDAALFIAPEENMELYKLTRLLESEGVQIMGSASEAVLICSDKRETYNALKGKVPLIETYDNVNFTGKIVVKPIDGVACQGIKIIESSEELEEVIKSTDSRMIIQKFVEGEPVSVSILSNGETALPLSLNRQNIEYNDGILEYRGGVTPFEHEMAADALLVAKRAVESIDGLRGYVGVDLILSDKIYVVELNSRITTPYIALRKLININLGKAIIAAVNGKIPKKWSINGVAEFKKGKDSMIIDIIG